MPVHKHESRPSRVWSFGCRPPVEGADLMADQMRLAHRYRNKLCELERDRREKTDAELRRLSPLLETTERAIAGAEQALEETLAEIRRQKASGRSHKAAKAQSRDRAKAQRESLKDLRRRRRELRRELFDSEKWKASQEAIAQADGAVRRAARAKSGLYWGTYLHVERSCDSFRKGAPPRFQRWRGDGHLAVQLQKGLTIADLMAGQDPRLRIVVDEFGDIPRVNRHGVELPRPRFGSRRGSRKRGRVYFRIGSAEGRAPVFAVLPILLHRDLPKDAEVKWAHLLRRRIGTRDRYEIQLVLARDSWAHADSAVTGAVGVDVGWRKRDDGSLRVAYWIGSDGAEGELCLPAEWLSGQDKVRSLISIRDRHTDALRPQLAAWLAGRALPEWLEQHAKTLAQWRSPGRFMGLAGRWRENRWEGDAEGYDLLETWRRQEAHLYDWQAFFARKLAGRRRDMYRCFAADLRRRYGTAVIEDLDLTAFHVLPGDEEGPPDERARYYVRDACLSELVSALRNSMLVTQKVPAKNTTATCASCGATEPWGPDLERECPGCGVVEDQDRNAARNLLGAAMERAIAGA